MATYTAYYPIHTYEADVAGKVTFAAIFRFLQDIAALHAGKIGYGLEDLKENESLWVLSRFLYRGVRTPLWQETLEIETWPTGTDRIFALRDWLIRDESGKEVARATSSWVVIDIVKRTPVRVERVAGRTDVIVDRHLFERTAAKLPSCEQGEPTFRTRANFADMDLNRHVNATRYVEWMFEGLPEGLRESGGELAEIEINFNGESRAGDELAVHTRDQPSSSTETEPELIGENDTREEVFLQSVTKGGEVVCRARSRWRTRL